jgi:predicted DNA-binding WGR domain protein
MSRYSFHAINPERNLKRWYEIVLHQDLFGGWCVTSLWGRLDQRGAQHKEAIFDSRDAALLHSMRLCRKRLNSHNRIGCNYVCTSHPLTLENVKEVTAASL